MKRHQSGFTLVEIAIVLVIIGLLLGGVLKGQELIAAARVRNLAGQQAGIQAAYYGFVDRYRAVPGDMPQAVATDALGVSINSSNPSTMGNGKIDPNWSEVNAVWEHLSKSGFIQGTYPGGQSSESTAQTAPTNVFNGILVLLRSHNYISSTSTSPPDRLVLYLGRNVPVDIARELDVKIDDGIPNKGILRNAASNRAAHGGLGQSAANCVANSSSGSGKIWNIAGNVQDCNPVYLF